MPPKAPRTPSLAFSAWPRSRGSNQQEGLHLFRVHTQLAGYGLDHALGGPVIEMIQHTVKH